MGTSLHLRGFLLVAPFRVRGSCSFEAERKFQNMNSDPQCYRLFHQISLSSSRESLNLRKFTTGVKLLAGLQASSLLTKSLTDDRRNFRPQIITCCDARANDHSKTCAMILILASNWLPFIIRRLCGDLQFTLGYLMSPATCEKTLDEL